MKSKRSAGSKRQGPVRFAVIGQGHFAQAAILPAFKTARDCQLVAIFSDDQTKLRALGRRYRVESALPYEAYDDYLRSGEADAVYIALPNDLHCHYAVLAAEGWTEGEPFLALNADNYYPVSALRDLAKLSLPGLIAFDREGLLADRQIPPERILRFALLDLDGNRLRRIAEKPDEIDAQHQMIDALNRRFRGAFLARAISSIPSRSSGGMNGRPSAL